jgi:hypothetical protein
MGTHRGAVRRAGRPAAALIDIALPSAYASMIIPDLRW